jgi:hypothetical protein
MYEGYKMVQRPDHDWTNPHSWVQPLVKNGLAEIVDPPEDAKDRSDRLQITDKGRTVIDHLLETEHIAEREPAAEEKLDRLLSTFERKIEETSGDLHEHALLHMLKRWRAQLPDPDDYFHKTFRQCDVLPTGHEDMVMWNLLGASKLFWQAFAEVNAKDTP